MQEQNWSLLDAFKREPEQTRWLLRFALAGPLAIFTWNIAGTLVLDLIYVSAVATLLTLLYGCILAVQVVRIMYSSGVWQAGATAATQRFTGDSSGKTDGSEQQEDSVATRPVTTTPHVNFHETHFLLQLQEEVNAARRSGEEVALVWLDVGVPGSEPTVAQLERMAAEVAGLLAGQSRTIGQSLNVSQTEYVFSLPRQSHASARAFVSKVVQALGSYWCHCGIASFPKDETDGEGLYRRARELCQESREEERRPPGSEVRVA